MINKTDLASAIGADLGVMERDALRMRDGGPLVFAQVFILSIIIGSRTCNFFLSFNFDQLLAFCRLSILLE